MQGSQAQMPAFAVMAAFAFSLLQDYGFVIGLIGVVSGIVALAVAGLRRLYVTGGVVLVWLALEAAQFFAHPSTAVPAALWPGHFDAVRAVAVLTGVLLLGLLGMRMFLWQDADHRLRVAYRVLLLGLVAGVGVIAVAGAPVMHDVQQYHEQAADRLLHGQPLNGEPYTIDGPFVESQDYPYMPLEAVLRAPFHALGDVRYAGLAALLATYPIVLALARSRGFAGAMPDALASLALVAGAPLFIVQQAWTEPLVLPLLAGGLLASVRGRGASAGVLLGLAAATKLWLLILLPVACASDRRTGLVATATTAATILPFALQDPLGLLDGAVLYHLAQPVRLDGVTLARLAPWWPTITGGLAWLVACILIAARRRSLGQGLLMASLGLALLFFLGPQANANYWWLLAPVLVLSGTMSAARIETHETVSQPAGVPAA